MNDLNSFISRWVLLPRIWSNLVKFPCVLEKKCVLYDYWMEYFRICICSSWWQCFSGFWNLADFILTCFINYWTMTAQVFNDNCGFLCCFFQLCQFLLHVSLTLVGVCMHIRTYYASLMNWPLYHYVMLVFNHFNSAQSGINIAFPSVFWFSCCMAYHFLSF